MSSSSSPAREQRPDGPLRRVQRRWRGLEAIRSAARFAHRPLAVGAAIALAIMVLLAVFAPVVATHNPNRLDPQLASQAPSFEHYLGTDELGRDLFSRIVFGGRVSLMVGLVGTTLGSVAGLLIGVLSAYWGGWFDLMIQRFVDVMLAFPTIILGLMIVAALGPSIPNLIAAIAVIIGPRTVRVVRAEALSVRQEVYIEAATAIGAKPSRITLRHIVPNVLAVWIVIASFELGRAILLEATLSFLGAGVQPPTSSWGGMLRGEALLAFETAPWIAFFPGLAIVVTVFAVNILGDVFRDVTDPRL